MMNAVMPTFDTQACAEQVLDALRERGFQHAQVSVSETARCELNIAHNEPSLLRSNDSRKLSATGIVDGRRASSEGNDLSARGVATLVDQLWDAARSAPQDEANAVSAGQHASVTKGPRGGRSDGTDRRRLRTLLDWRAEHTPTVMIEEALRLACPQPQPHPDQRRQLASGCDLGWCELSVFGLAREGRATSSASTTPAAWPHVLAEVPQAFGVARMMQRPDAARCTRSRWASASSATWCSSPNGGGRICCRLAHAAAHRRPADRRQQRCSATASASSSPHRC
jgi:PmbA protein